jgi:mRNA interferase MazF
MSQLIRRGDVFWANLDPTVGVEIKKKRPVVVMSNDVINQRSRLVIVVPLTTNLARLSPSHVLIPRGEGGLNQDSKVLTEQIRAIDKQRLVAKIGTLSNRFLRLIEQAIRNSLDM